MSRTLFTVIIILLVELVACKGQDDDFSCRFSSTGATSTTDPVIRGSVRLQFNAIGAEKPGYYHWYSGLEDVDVSVLGNSEWRSRTDSDGCFEVHVDQDDDVAAYIVKVTSPTGDVLGSATVQLARRGVGWGTFPPSVLFAVPPLSMIIFETQFEDVPLLISSDVSAQARLIKSSGKSMPANTWRPTKIGPKQFAFAGLPPGRYILSASDDYGHTSYFPGVENREDAMFIDLGWTPMSLGVWDLSALHPQRSGQ